jgi:hypothetical protein
VIDPYSSPFSEFIRNASPDEKRRVYKRVMDDSTARQRGLVMPRRAPRAERIGLPG